MPNTVALLDANGRDEIGELAPILHRAFGTVTWLVAARSVSALQELQAFAAELQQAGAR